MLGYYTISNMTNRFLRVKFRRTWVISTSLKIRTLRGEATDVNVGDGVGQLVELRDDTEVAITWEWAVEKNKHSHNSIRTQSSYATQLVPWPPTSSSWVPIASE